MGESFTLTAGVLPAEANQGISWHSSDNDVATVDCSGVVTAHGVGTVEIKAKSTFDDDQYATCLVAVVIPLTGVTVSPTSLEIKVDEVAQITRTITPTNATNPITVWTTSNPNVATVNVYGIVKGEGFGTATITARVTAGGVTRLATSQVKVYAGRANIDVLYDGAYISRFTNAPTRINDSFVTVKEKYLNDWGILLNNSTPTQFASYADNNCTAFNEVCPHGENDDCKNSWIYLFYGWHAFLENLHHKNIDNIMLRIPFPDTSSTLRVAFIGHVTCSKDGETHGEGYAGLAYSEIGLVSVTNFSSAFQETRTTAHEIGHLFASNLDHYGGSTPSTDPNKGQSSECIYGEDRWELTELTTCTYCTDRIGAQATKYNH